MVFTENTLKHVSPLQSPGNVCEGGFPAGVKTLRGTSSTEVNPGLQAESSRNDSGFLAITLAAFVLPALLILSIAVGTGYLDKLAGGYGTGM